jgi:hypothetical protein
MTDLESMTRMIVLGLEQNFNSVKLMGLRRAIIPAGGVNPAATDTVQLHGGDSSPDVFV